MSFYRLLADLVVAVHAGYVAAVAGGLALILAGIVLRWTWIRNFWFRIVHFLMIAAVASESLLGIGCPLTTLEDYLRGQAGESVEEGSFVGRWAHQLVFYDVPESLLTAVYCVCAAVVLLTLLLAPPRRPGWLRRQQGLAEE